METDANQNADMATINWVASSNATAAVEFVMWIEKWEATIYNVVRL